MNKHKNTKTHFVVCLDNEGYAASLEVGKLYRTIPDAEAKSHGYLRVMDESGEDYAYAQSRFHSVALPAAVEEKLQAVAHGCLPDRIG